MIQAIQRRLAARQGQDNQSGFTLIELMVVVMIIAILVGIAIPAFLGARKRAQDTASKSNLRNALSTAQTIFTDNQAYLATADVAGPPLVKGMVSTLIDEEPSLSFKLNTVASTKAKEISVLTGNSGIAGTSGNDAIYLASLSGSGNCFYYRHVATAGNAISGTFTASAKTAACSGDDAAALAAGAWSPL